MRDDDGIRGRLRALGRRQQRFELGLASHLGVDAAGLATMNHLGTRGPATPTEIARALEISTAATSLVLQRLEAAGHVERAPHPTDGRKSVVTPAPASLAAGYALVEPVADGIDGVVAAMSARDRRVVERFLEAVVQVYDDASRDAPGYGRRP